MLAAVATTAWLATTAARAAPERFPLAPVPASVAVDLLAPSRVGPPATAYDQTGSTTGATELERDIERRTLGADHAWPAPEGLRRYGAMLLELRGRGQPHDLHEQFMAEHAGLTVLPRAIGWFSGDGTKPDRLAERIERLTYNAKRDPDLRAIAVTIRDTESHHLVAGVVTGIFSSVALEPFPRTWERGAVAELSGTVRDDDTPWALWVAYPGAEVRTFPIEGRGSFAMKVPLPDQPGAYRAALGPQRRKAMPDTPYFFTMYVAAQPPKGFEMPGGKPATGRDSAKLEDRFLARVNRERARNGLDALERAGSSEALRSQLSELSARDHPRWGAIQGLTVADPLPDEPHGTWTAAFGVGYGVDDTAWLALANPISRERLLDEAATKVVLGAAESHVGLAVLALPIAPASDPVTSRSATFELISRDWPAEAEPQLAPMLEAKLDALCVEVAGGTATPQGALRRTQELFQDTDLMAGGANVAIFVVPPGKTPNLGTFKVPSASRHLAIGNATGTLGEADMSPHTVLLVVVAEQAS